MTQDTDGKATAMVYDTSEMDEMGGSRELGESALGRGELTRVLLLSQSGESTEAPVLSQENP